MCAYPFTKQSEGPVWYHPHVDLDKQLVRKLWELLPPGDHHKSIAYPSPQLRHVKTQEQHEG